MPIEELENTKNRTLVVIPVYNNERTIKQVIEQCQEFTESVLVVNDGSTDQTSKLIEESCPRYIVDLEDNYGKGRAIIEGARFAKDRGYKYMITLDADGQHFPSDLPIFLSQIQKNPGTILIGCRKMNGEGGDIPGSSIFGRKFSNFWVWVETGHKLPDTQSGYRLYPVKSLLHEKWSRSRYDFEIEVIVKNLWRKIPIKSVPISVFYPKKGSRVSSFRPFMDNLRLTSLHARLVSINLLNLLTGGMLLARFFRWKDRQLLQKE